MIVTVGLNCRLRYSVSGGGEVGEEGVGRGGDKISLEIVENPAA